MLYYKWIYFLNEQIKSLCTRWCRHEVQTTNQMSYSSTNKFLIHVIQSEHLCFSFGRYNTKSIKNTDRGFGVAFLILNYTSTNPMCLMCLFLCHIQSTINQLSDIFQSLTRYYSKGKLSLRAFTLSTLEYVHSGYLASSPSTFL